MVIKKIIIFQIINYFKEFFFRVQFFMYQIQIKVLIDLIYYFMINVNNDL